MMILDAPILWFTLPYILFNLTDGYYTYKCLQFPKTSEANPFIRALMKKIGIAPALIVVKAFLIAFIVIAARMLPNMMSKELAILILAALTLPFIYLTYRNYAIYQRRKKAAEAQQA